MSKNTLNEVEFSGKEDVKALFQDSIAASKALQGSTHEAVQG